jgi:ketose-bisphosphate aldolase
MPLVPIPQLIARAQSGSYAIGYFESWNFESLSGVIDAAEQSGSPIIIGFNGDFLSRPERGAAERLSWYGALGKAAAVNAKVPVGFIFNECPRDEWVMRACDEGFNLVMPSDPAAPYEEYVRRVSAVVAHARARGVAVEAEIGELPCGESGEIVNHGTLPTDPAQAADFARRTQVDLLAVSVGNIHIMIAGEQDLDLELLGKIHKATPVPLVLHGGSGISGDSLKQAAALGVVKVNYGTYLKQWYLDAIREWLPQAACNPHEVLGIGGNEDMMVAGRLAVRDAVLSRIELLGCCGKAWS